MIRSRFLEREEWEAKLRRWGCQPLEGLTALNTAEWWIGPRKRPFTVPVEDDAGQCDFWAIQHLAEDFGEHPSPDLFC